MTCTRRMPPTASTRRMLPPTSRWRSCTRQRDRWLAIARVFPFSLHHDLLIFLMLVAQVTGAVHSDIFLLLFKFFFRTVYHA